MTELKLFDRKLKIDFIWKGSSGRSEQLCEQMRIYRREKGGTKVEMENTALQLRNSINSIISPLDTADMGLGEKSEITHKETQE